jgi:signal transduction histidine kinase
LPARRLSKPGQSETARPPAPGAGGIPRILRSSSFRLVVVYAALFFCSVLVLLGYIYWSTASYMGREVDATIEAEITGLAERYRRDGLPGLSQTIAERLSRKPAGTSIYLLADNRLRPLVGNLDGWPQASPDTDGWLEFELGGDDWAGRRHLARARQFRLRGRFNLLVGRDIFELREIRNLITRALVWGALITMVLALLGGVMMSRTLLRRIEMINATSREIMAGDLAQRVSRDFSGDELDELARSLNLMLDRIETLVDEVRRVSDNIAHDLRTPLARLRNRLELLRFPAQGGSPDPQAVDRAVAEADALLGTFNALLRIARIESEQRRAGFASVDLAVLVGDVAELYRPVIEERGQRLDIHVPGPCIISGDRDLLFQSVANLLDNAAKYTPGGGHIRLALIRGGEEAAIIVADDGPGIPVDAHEKVFRRFYRVDGSRSTPGNGLGLSLVAAVAALHGGQVRLEDNAPGLRVILTLPGYTGGEA